MGQNRKSTDVINNINGGSTPFRWGSVHNTKPEELLHLHGRLPSLMLWFPPVLFQALICHSVYPEPIFLHFCGRVLCTVAHAHAWILHLRSCPDWLTFLNEWRHWNGCQSPATALKAFHGLSPYTSTDANTVVGIVALWQKWFQSDSAVASSRSNDKVACLQFARPADFALVTQFDTLLSLRLCITCGQPKVGVGSTFPEIKLHHHLEAIEAETDPFCFSLFSNVCFQRGL